MFESFKNSKPVNGAQRLYGVVKYENNKDNVVLNAFNDKNEAIIFADKCYFKNYIKNENVTIAVILTDFKKRSGKYKQALNIMLVEYTISCKNSFLKVKNGV